MRTGSAITVIAATGLALVTVWMFLSGKPAIIENPSTQPTKPNPASSKNTAKSERREPVENFKHDARRIGGTAFPVPDIDAGPIARAPSINSTVTTNPQIKTPVFLMQRPVIQDITTIQSGTKTVKLANVVPLPVETVCRTKGKTRPCGKIARTALRALVRGRTLTCITAPADPDDNSVTTSCKVGNTDIAGWLIKHGWSKPAKMN